MSYNNRFDQDSREMMHTISLGEIFQLEEENENAKRSLGQVSFKGEHPIYPQPVLDFMNHLHCSPWNDFSQCNTFEEFMEVLNTIDRANFKSCCEALVTARNSESYRDGVWVKVMNDNLFGLVIERLKELKVAELKRLN